MTATEFNRHQTPPSGWIFRQPETGWTAPTPIGSTFSQTVDLIIAMRRKNPAIGAKAKWATDRETVGTELERYTRKRLGLPEEQAQPPFTTSSRSGGAVAAVAGSIQRAAQGSAVWIEWLRKGGIPVDQTLAEKRAATCVACSRNVDGEWYVQAPAQLLGAAIEQWKSFTKQDFKFETAQGDALKSCGVCHCMSKIKVFIPLPNILEKTKPEILAEFPAHCWIASHDA